MYKILIFRLLFIGFNQVAKRRELAKTEEKKLL